MAATPEKPGYVLFWIAAVVVTIPAAMKTMLRDDAAAPDSIGGSVVSPASTMEQRGPLMSDPAPSLMPYPFSEGLELVSFAAASDQVMAASGYVRVQGQITDSSGVPCPNARITVHHGTNNLLLREALAVGRDAFYHVDVIPAQTPIVTLKAHFKGYSSRAKTVDLSKAESLYQVNLCFDSFGLAPSLQNDMEEASLRSERHPPHHYVPPVQEEAGSYDLYWTTPPYYFVETYTENEENDPTLPRKVRVRVQKSLTRPGYAFLSVWYFFKDLGVTEEQLETTLRSLPKDIKRSAKQRAAHPGPEDRDDDQDSIFTFGSLLEKVPPSSEGRVLRLLQKPKMVEVILELEEDQVGRVINRLLNNQENENEGEGENEGE